MAEPQARPSGRTRRARPRSAALPGAIGVAPARPSADEVDWRGSVELNTAHCTIVVIDVEGFGRYSRTNPNKIRIRRGMYRALERAFAAAGIPWGVCQYSDLGDGVLVLGPAAVSKTPFAERLPGALAEELAWHNGAHPQQEHIRLRLALHAGEVTYDAHGVTGSSILDAQRLVDAPALKRALAGTSAVLATIASSWFYEEVVRQSEGGDAGDYRPVDVVGDDFPVSAWVRLLFASAPRR
ncbi:hypothetical protein ABZ342_15835 [Amycolatopsis sp. NPDC005961]|uniref:hypothetical protein n=1 Tax=Amycolatopsis sp. NPDC005961 TaxID=3156720 RepID=UPI0033E4052F